MDIGIAEDGSHLMLIMWDQYGLEAVIDVTKEEKQQLFDLIAGRNDFTTWLNSTVSYLVMRARANSQRNSEVYSIWVDDGLTEDDVADAFAENPQNMADLIRERGTALVRSSRGSQKQVIF